MFEQQITEYLQPYGMKPAVQEDIVAAVGSRLTQQPCRPDPALAGNLLLQYVLYTTSSISFEVCFQEHQIALYF